MEPFEATCVLWLPGDRDAAVGGTLRFDRVHGLSADLIGSLDPDEPIANLFEMPNEDELAELTELPAEDDAGSHNPGPVIPVLHGVVQGRSITLLNVRRTDGYTAIPGHAHDRLSPEVLIRGEHLSNGFDTLLSVVAVAFDALPAWYETALRGENVPGRVSNQSSERVLLEWTTPKPLQATLDSGDVMELLAKPDRHDGLSEFRIALRPRFEMRYSAARSLRDAMGIVTPLRWLLSLVTRQPARITSLHGVLADNPRAVFEVIYQSIEPRDDARYVHPYAMAVKLPDFDVPVALPRWFDIYERLRTPMALFFANWFSSGLYMENRVLNAAGAVESLARLLYPDARTDLSNRPEAVAEFLSAFPPAEHDVLRSRLAHLNDPSLRERLRQLTADAGEAFNLVVSDTYAWIGQVVDTRNDIAHGKRLEASGPWLRALAETVEYLFEVHLLIQLGMTVNEIKHALKDTPRTHWIANLADEHLRAGPVP